MNVIDKPLSELHPYENNPRVNDDAVPYVVNSIREFGFKVPLVIDKDGVIITGHTRYKAAQQLGLETVPCVIADDLTPEQAKAFRIADNKVSEIAKWDLVSLEQELGDIQIDMSDFGIVEVSDIDVDGFFDDVENGEEPAEEKEAREVKCPHCGMYFTLD